MPAHRRLPQERPNRFRPPAEYAELRREEPVAKVCLPGGGEAWLVTAYHHAKAVLADARFSLTGPGTAPNDDTSPMGDGDNHQRFRRLVSGLLTTRRINAFRPRAETIARDLTARMLAKGPGADLVTHLCRPLPLTVICELLGIEIEDGEVFHHWVEASVALVVPPDDPELVGRYAATAQELWEYMSAVVENERNHPGAGLLAEIVKDRQMLSAEERINVAITLLITGYITTANALSTGLVDLATTHGFAGLTDDDAIARTVEEILRRQSGPGNEALPRWAVEQVVLDGRQISANDLVLVRLEAANHDPCQFAEPESFDRARTANSHLAFGYGRHHCLGAGLARIELRAAVRAISEQCPSLTIAPPAEEIPWTGHPFEDGPASIAVTW